ncbi:MAG: exodeoxyribonuclease III [Nocardioides sp.]
MVALRPQRPQADRSALPLQARLAGAPARGGPPWLTEQETALVGDWNICPTDGDVFDPAQFVNSTHVTPAERAAFQGFLDDGYAEVTRAHAPGYTYWDYYRQRFERDRGLKIDFVLANPVLAARVTGAFIDREERAGQGASDHAPVVVDLS